MFIFIKFRKFLCFISLWCFLNLFSFLGTAKIQTLKKNNDIFKISTQKLGFIHIFMKFWKYSLFYLFFIIFEFSLDDFLGSLVTNEFEKSFGHYQHNIVLGGKFFFQILRIYFFIIFFFVVSANKHMPAELQCQTKYGTK